MFKIQQINCRKIKHFKFLEITSFPIFTNQQINSILHIVHYTYDHKCSQFNRSTAEKNTILNFSRSQISQINKSTAFAHSPLFIQSQMFTIQQVNGKKKHNFK